MGFGLVILSILLIAGCAQNQPSINNTNNSNGSVPIPPINNNTNNSDNNSNNSIQPGSIPPDYQVKDYCRLDTDCVRQESCCDCGLGTYVNFYNHQNVSCEGKPRCMCPIANSVGKCIENKCTAVPFTETPGSGEIKKWFNFSSEDGKCGAEIKPIRTNFDYGPTFNGSVGVPNPCASVNGEIVKVSDQYYILNITSKPIPGVGSCIECTGTIPWTANISGFYGRVEVYYDNRLVFPDLKNFCGVDTLGSCNSNNDCMASGCSAQICQSKFEKPLVTTCEWKSCYSQYYGAECGCVANKCQWH